MPALPEAGDSNIWTAFYWAVGGIVTAMVSGFLFLLGIVSKQNDAINKSNIAEVTGALDVEKRFATKDDIDRLEARLNESMRGMLREHEVNVSRDMDRRIAQLQSIGRG